MNIVRRIWRGLLWCVIWWCDVLLDALADNDESTRLFIQRTEAESWIHDREAGE